MILAIDSGNTYTKIGFFDEGKLIKIIQISATDDINRELDNISFDGLVVSSVHLKIDDIVTSMQDRQILIVNNTIPLPFKVAYKTPGTLGSDRLAVVAGAIDHFPHSNLLIIQTGTCITYDFIDEDGNFQGGGISPGIEMRFKSLNKYTENLPLVSFDENYKLVGKSTEESIQTGVILGCISEIQGIIDRYNQNYRGLKVVITGGFTKFFETKLKDRIFAVPNLVLWGLYSIYAYNNSKG